ncbi:MAG: 50S ribosomal protein L6 [Gammaproteobacteria bacterium]|nr:50S ribosomal protein L6 [Gammaproteobacteria bacterium]
MSRVAKRPIKIPRGVEVKIDGRDVAVKGAKGAMTHRVPAAVDVTLEGDSLQVKMAESSKRASMFAGTTRALLNNLVAGVSSGFERRLEINGVGYRAAVQGKSLNLTLGFSHPISFAIPEGISIETPSQTEIVVKGMNKQLVGEVAAKIRAYRPPEPYKGKGVKYANETILRKEAKKT